MVNCGMMVQESLLDHELLESHPRARAFVLRQWKPHCGVFPSGQKRRDLRVCRQIRGSAVQLSHCVMQ